MPYISIESGRLTAEQKKQLIERLTATASEILCKAKRFAYSHIPAQFFTVTIKELPDENFGIGGKSIDEIKRNYQP
jgi:oxalocrotonate tautomerase